MRRYTFGDAEAAKVGEAGFDSFDYGRRIAFWVKDEDGVVHWSRSVPISDACQLARALLTAEK